MDSTPEIVRLRPEEFEEAIDFLNFVFSQAHAPHDFELMFPRQYRRDRMGWNYALRGPDGIRAVAGVFPISWRVGETVLRVAGVGGVSTHPRYRGKGYMGVLMGHCAAEMRREGYPLSYLAGQRQRYLRFGYEACGVSHIFSFLRENFPSAAPPAARLQFEPLERGRDVEIRRAKGFHDVPWVHGIRPEPDFWDICASWYNRLHVARDGTGEMVGYVVADAAGDHIAEIIAADSAHLLPMVRDWLRDRDRPRVRVNVPPFAAETVRLFAPVAERVETHAAGHWQVFDWPVVVEAFLQVRRTLGPSAEGTMFLGIEGGPTLRITAEGETTACRTTDEAAGLVCPAPVAMRMLFGPLPPAAAAPHGAHLGLLSSWCPLPLCLPKPDTV